MEFTLDELEIIGWALEDHATKVLTRAKEFGLNERRPNLAYLDTMILRNRVEAELERRRIGRD